MKNIKIGDIIVSNDDYYAITNRKAGWTGIVTDILICDTDEQIFSAKTITPIADIGKPYCVLSSAHFDVVHSTQSPLVKVGDTVRVKTIDDIEKSAMHPFGDMYLGQDGIYFNKEMRILCGRECIVESVNNTSVRTYQLTDKLSGTTFSFNYTDWMFTKEDKDEH